jgi:hypothetical protein
MGVASVRKEGAVHPGQAGQGRKAPKDSLIGREAQGEGFSSFPCHP